MGVNCLHNDETVRGPGTSSDIDNCRELVEVIVCLVDYVPHVNTVLLMSRILDTDDAKTRLGSIFSIIFWSKK